MATIGSKERPIWTFPATDERVEQLKQRLEELGYTDVEDGPGANGRGYRDVWGKPPQSRTVPEGQKEFWEVFGVHFKQFAEVCDPSD